MREVEYVFRTADRQTMGYRPLVFMRGRELNAHFKHAIFSNVIWPCAYCWRCQEQRLKGNRCLYLSGNNCITAQAVSSSFSLNHRFNPTVHTVTAHDYNTPECLFRRFFSNLSGYNE